MDASLFKKVVIFIVVMLLLVQLKGCLFAWDVKGLYEKRQWSKVLDVETVVVRQKFVDINNWIATVQADDNKVTAVFVRFGPIPKTGDCMPIVATYLDNGKVYALLDAEEWRFGTDFGPCD